MLNSVVIVGRVKNITSNSIELAIYLDSKSSDFDLIPVLLEGNLSTKINTLCTLDTLTGVKGKLVNRDGKLVVVAQKLTFLSSVKEEN